MSVLCIIKERVTLEKPYTSWLFMQYLCIPLISAHLSEGNACHRLSHGEKVTDIPY